MLWSNAIKRTKHINFDDPILSVPYTVKHAQHTQKPTPKLVTLPGAVSLIDGFAIWEAVILTVF